MANIKRKEKDSGNLFILQKQLNLPSPKTSKNQKKKKKSTQNKTKEKIYIHTLLFYPLLESYPRVSKPFFVFSSVFKETEKKPLLVLQL
mmetsp:Transcript_52811/g.60476  ORF Transcript_52811/g.60476 Transcript_52811/m.60476 type:complete len:89 (+) Transcript_52811:1874-2140(+)